MPNERLGTVSRRAVLATGALASLAGVATAAPPKGVDPVRSQRDLAVRKIGEMRRTIARIQVRLEPCDDTVCEAVLQSASGRVGLTASAIESAEDRDWAATSATLTEVRGIVVADIALLEGVDDRGHVGDVLGLERALLEQTDTALRAVDRAAG